MCKGTGDEKKMTVTLMCDPNEHEMKYMDQRFYKSECKMELRYKSKGGCPVLTQGQVEKFMNENKFLVGMIMIGLGAVLAFTGYYFLDFVIFAVSFASFSLAISYIALVLTDKGYGENQQPDWLLWVIFGGALLAGGLAAWMITKCRKFGIGLLAACGGIALGILICQMTAINNTIIYYAILGACAIGTCILVSFLEKPLCIAITSFLGSYMLVRGVSLFAGGYPSEFQVAELIKQHIMPWTQYKWFWAYLVAVLILSLLSACFQNQITGKGSQRSNSNQQDGSATHGVNER